MKSKEVKALLSKHNIDMKVYVDAIGDGIVYDYIEKYKDWKLGDKVRLATSLDKMSLSEEEMPEYEQLVGKIFTIQSFYNVGAMDLCEFDYGVDMDYFEKVS